MFFAGEQSSIDLPCSAVLSNFDEKSVILGLLSKSCMETSMDKSKIALLSQSASLSLLQFPEYLVHESLKIFQLNDMT